jgi:uncharacterized protein YgbK (DUF1537 family)
MPLLGCIADDFTGATDLASMLVRNGMRTVQVIGVPTDSAAPDADAVVVALKSRTAPAAAAVTESLAALRWLQAAGCRQIFFKYCSTFDSTPAGNIGPVADALLHALGAGFALACPAFPANGRTVYQGHLFVGDKLLNESGMEHHPLTPMRDSNLVRVLSAQTDGAVALIAWATVAEGPVAIRRAATRWAEQGRRYAIVDAITDADLMAIGQAAAPHALVTGGSGLAMGLPENFRRAGVLAARDDPGALDPIEGGAAVIAGSCSRMTLRQIETAREALPVLALDAIATPDAAALTRQAIGWADALLAAGETRPLLIAASAPPDKVAALQTLLGREAAATLVETTLADVAAHLVRHGVRRLVVAGGETSGAVVSRLGIRQLRIGDEIDPGVPWTATHTHDGPLHLALKSGNFGAADFFLKAFD